MSPEQLARIRSGASQRADNNKKTAVSTIGIVGLGYVGLPLAVLAASKGYRVVGFDIDEVKVAQLQMRHAHFLSDEEQDRFQKAQTLSISSNPSDIRHLDAYIICVPTPVYHDHEPDLRPLESASSIVGRAIASHSLVVVESTVNPGVCENVSLPLIEKESGLPRTDFYFAHCPERINPGDEKWNVRTIPRVLGGLNPESLQRAKELYESLVEGEIKEMSSIKEAEAVKMVENSFRDINIAFVNELAMAFDKAGIDVVNVIKGAATKPFGFMPHYPGAGVGGHCIPVDPYYLIRYGQENGFEHQFLMTARRINNHMPVYTVNVLADALKERRRIHSKGKQNLKGATVALLGLSYKRDVPDMRESPALVIQQELEKRGARVRTFDPYLLGLSTARTLEEALKGADAAIIATDHALFCSLSPRHFETADISVVIDGRNCLQKDAFARSSVTYRGIGRR
jgi:UDP-N-acetyl-D-glucosamine dehydrogenase